jgi:hypothetical protein
MNYLTFKILTSYIKTQDKEEHILTQSLAKFRVLYKQTKLDIAPAHFQHRIKLMTASGSSRLKAGNIGFPKETLVKFLDFLVR